MRIKAPAAKVGYLLVVGVGITLTMIPLAAVSLYLGFAWAVVSVLAAVAVAARTFRGPTELDAPRPWWKMTSTRRSSILLAVLFFLQGVATSVGALTAPSPSLALIGSVVSLLLTALYLNSAWRIHPIAVSA
ncbi:MULTISPECIES: hypothetical protein [Microbacterium]|uniref:Uncharacterized protein n=1 Tax=Microbacterium sufflavum TaxID=2851649 RepID=A0ABY4IES3_9MICO|nr:MULTISPECIES: hypothetical protein [Microbacterium]UPL10476.1 hypothetical protein KV394_04875 [Microbacterium sufflavum]